MQPSDENRASPDRMASLCAHLPMPDDLARALLADLVAASGSPQGLVLLPLPTSGTEARWSLLSHPGPAVVPPPWSMTEWHAALGPLRDDTTHVLLNEQLPQGLALLQRSWPALRRALVLRLLLDQACIGWVVLADGEEQGTGQDGRDGFPSAVLDGCLARTRAEAPRLGAALMRSQRDLALRALRDKEAGYAAVFEMAAVGIALTSPSGRFFDANPRFCEIVGRSRTTLLDCSMADITHPDDVAQELAQLEAVSRGETPGSRFTREHRYLRPDGSTVWAVVKAVLVRDAAGRPDHYVATVEDVTERKRYQDAMIATQAAERANRAKSEFLSRMSHELRTPLNAMLGFAQLLRVDVTQPLSSAQRQKIEHIERAGAHLLAMINDVLDLSRIESGVVPMSVETLQAGSVIEDALHLVASAAREADIRLIWHPPLQPLYVQADRVRFRQVLTNLLSNAIKYNYPGGHVTISLDRQAWREGTGVTVSIADTGPGLNEEQIARLFEPFNRLGAERSGVEGTGIGLVITRRLLELMQGRIDVDSEPGRGSTFTVRLPQAAPPAVLPLQETGRSYAPVAGADLLDDEEFLTSPSPLEMAETPSTTPRPFTVLYAEDNEVNVELVRQVMRMRPAYRLLVAHSGAQAIELARTQRPDLLLLDMHLGDMSGLDVVAALDRDQPTAGLPRVALSADALPDQIQAARERGFKTYLTKPLDVGALLRALDERAQASRPAA